jgi:hypothetical protein
MTTWADLLEEQLLDKIKLPQEITEVALVA